MKIAELSSRGSFRAAKFVIISLIFCALTSCATTGAQILDKDKGWIQINRGNRVEVYFCDATQKWPTCKTPEYVRLAD